MSLLQIDNFDGNLVMETNIINNSNLNLYECNNSTDTNKVISYFKNDSIINLNAFKNTKIIKNHTKGVNSLLLLKDNRIASCSSDKTIRILNPSKNFTCDEILERHRDNVISLCQLDDGTIISASKDRSIKIGNSSISSAHEYSIYKVITLPNNRIASCSLDNAIKIWKSDPPYSPTPLIVLNEHGYGVRSLLYIKQKDILVSGAGDKDL